MTKNKVIRKWSITKRFFATYNPHHLVIPNIEDLDEDVIKVVEINPILEELRRVRDELAFDNIHTSIKLVNKLIKEFKNE